MDFLTVDQRSHQPIDKPGVDIFDVGIDVADDVTLELVDGLPEVFTLAPLVPHTGQDVSGQIYVCAIGCSDFACAVRRAGVDDGKLVDERVTLH